MSGCQAVIAAACFGSQTCTDFDAVVQRYFGSLSVAVGPGLISGANLSFFYLSLEALPVAALIVIAAVWTGVSWWITN